MGATPLIFRTSRVSSESSASVTCEPQFFLQRMLENHQRSEQTKRILQSHKWHQTIHNARLFGGKFCHIPTKLSDQVCLVDNDAICKGQLLHCFILNPFGFLFMQVLEAVFGIHHGDDAILVFKCFKSGCDKGVFFQP